MLQFKSMYYTTIFCCLKFNYELRGVIGRALASHAIDPGSNPGHAMYISFFKFVNFYWVTTGYHGLPRVTMGYHGLPRVTTGYS